MARRARFDHSDMRSMLRLYSAVSLAGILLATALIFFYVRKVAIDDIVDLAERSNITLAQSVLGLVRQDLVEFLESAKDVKAGRSEPPHLPGGLDDAINDLMANTAVVRLKIYNAAGVAVFSTQFHQIGQAVDKNGAFQAALSGRVVSDLAYRDAFDPFDRPGEDDNLVQTYIPVQRSATEPIVGVFVIYGDGNPLVARNERASMQMLAGVGFILGVLYLALLYVARRASGVIGQQQQTIRERTAALEMLSAHMLSSEEEEKRFLALELHEGLAQTLVSIKVHLDELGAENHLIGTVQTAIDDVRKLAMRLRPPSLDELGLLPTLNSLSDSFERAYPDMHVEKRIELEEDDMPPPLKIVVYRVIESALRNLARYSTRGSVELTLAAHDDAILLELDYMPRDAGYLATRLRQAGDHVPGFAKIREQIALSGGSFEVKYDAALGVSLHAVWLRVSLRDALAGRTVLAQRRA
jgi:two-component system, NarL family, sensor kinase